MENKLSLVKDSFKELPNNIEAEQAVIGSILVSNEIFDEVNLIIKSDNFYDPMHKKIYSALENLIYKGMLANPITLKNYFEDEKDDLNVPEYLVKITKFSTSSRQAIEYSKIIYDMFVRRELIKISEQTIDNAKLNDLNVDGKNILEGCEKSLYELAENGSYNNSSIIQFHEAVRQTIEMASIAYKNDEGIVGVPTGLRDLDDRLGGLHKSDLIIIAGRPGMGKTALATNIAFNAAKSLQDKGKKSSVAFSLEMSSEQLSTRILAEQSRIKSNDIRRGRISDEQFDKFIETSKNIAELPLLIDETPAISIAAMSNRARRLKRKEGGLDLIVVDYIQLMRGSSNSKDGRVQEISEITQGLKALAKELSVPVIALSQLSRAVEQRDNKKPQLSDLRESGSIEQDADVVMFVYREAYYLENKEPRPATVEHAEWQAKMNEISNLAEVLIQKQRHGPTGNIMLEFEAMYTKFKDTQIS